jgi:hypothetical protein
MNCEEANIHLPEYLDKTLDTATMTRVATHIISCANCGTEADELIDCIKQVAALPSLDPPIGFAQRVIAHVRELEEKPTIWQRLFLPWSQKIPLPAMALVMVGVLGVLLYQKNEQLQQTNPRNIPLSTSVEPGNTANQVKPAAAFQSDQKEKLAAKTVIEQSKRNERAAQNNSVALPSRDQVASAKPEIEAHSGDIKATKRPPIQVQEVSNPREPGRFANDTIGFGGNFAPAGIRQTAPQTVLVPAERFAVPLFDRSADIEFVVRRHPAQRRDLLSSGSAAPNTAPMAEIRFYNVDPEHYEFFKKELASEAIIESESKAAGKEKEVALADRQLLIKVTILPPAMSESSTPAR